MISHLKEKYKEALPYHEGGKIDVSPSKQLLTRYDLSLAYTPGVAIPCMEIADDPAKAYDYTTKSNLVAVISNGTAVLGLGDIGALASKPVMEGKAVLFKAFAGISAFDIEVNETDPDRLVDTIKAIAPTFGGINLEDIRAPECFYIERRLKEELDIPVMHDDQHGTAIITAAAIMNALEISGKSLQNLKIVIVGAGAAAIASGRMYRHLGAENIVMLDSRGVIHNDRTDLRPCKQEFAIDTGDRTLADALRGADMVLGLSKGNLIDESMLKSMADEPIIFALSNPIPEVSPELVQEVRPDAIMATGRSDYPNQVNNVLGFPYIFRGALDVRSSAINYPMMIAAAKALAELTKQEVPEGLLETYGLKNLSFGKEYLIPLPFDRRLRSEISSAVAQAAMESNVARKMVAIDTYREKLCGRC